MTVKRSQPHRLRTLFTAGATSALSLIGLACGGASEPVEGLQAYIHEGQLESAYPAVGQFAQADFPNGYCTGTLIDPSWVLTARHCQDMVRFLTGPDGENTVSYPLDGQRFTQPTGRTNEVTLVHLTNPIHDVPLAEINQGSLPEIGTECTAVGFGRHDNGDGTTTIGTKRSSTSVVKSADEYELTVSEITGRIDSGDSGGPLICDGKVVAVARNRGGFYSPLDAAWIARAIANPSSQPEQPPTAPEVPDISAEVSFVGYQGDLCPPGTLTFEDGLIWGSWPELFPEVDTQQSCRIDLTVHVPAGLTFDNPSICSQLYALNEPVEARFAYSFHGAGGSPTPRTVPLAADSTTQCDVVSLSPNVCEDPTQPTDIPVTIEISAPLQAGNAVILSVLDVQLAQSNGTSWSSCDVQEKPQE